MSFPRKNVTPANIKPGRESNFLSTREDCRPLKSALDFRLSRE